MNVSEECKEEIKISRDMMFQAMVGTVGLKKTMDIYHHYTELKEILEDDRMYKI